MDRSIAGELIKSSDGKLFELDRSAGETLTLKSSDGELFKLDEEVTSFLYKIEDYCIDNVIAVPGVNSKILAKVIEYCRKHVEFNSKTTISYDKSDDDKINLAWDAEFVKVDYCINRYIGIDTNDMISAISFCTCISVDAIVDLNELGVPSQFDLVVVGLVIGGGGLGVELDMFPAVFDNLGKDLVADAQDNDHAVDAIVLDFVQKARHLLIRFKKLAVRALKRKRLASRSIQFKKLAVGDLNKFDSN